MREDRGISRWSVLLAAAAAALGLGFAAPAAAEVESNDPIILTIHDWTGQYITTNIMGEVLKKAGYNVEYVQADYIAQFAGLESGDLHVAMEIWETTGKQAMDASLKTGKTVDLGETGWSARGSTMVTSTLLFSTSGDAVLRAHDKQTGRTVARIPLPAPATGVPMTYEVDGTQYVVVAVAAAGHAPELVALSLP